MATDLNIKELTTQLSTYRKEIKNRREELKKLVTIEKEIKAKISKFLKDNNLPGVKANGIAIINEKKQVSLRKKKSEIKNDALAVLERYMDPAKAKKLYNEMQNIEKIEKQELKIISINK